MIDGEVALGHDLFKISEAEVKPQTPAYTQDDDLGFKNVALLNSAGRFRCINRKLIRPHHQLCNTAVPPRGADSNMTETEMLSASNVVVKWPESD